MGTGITGFFPLSLMALFFSVPEGQEKPVIPVPVGLFSAAMLCFFHENCLGVHSFYAAGPFPYMCRLSA